LLLIAEHGELGLAYNIGGADEYSNLEVANLVCNEIGLDPDKHIAFEADRPFNDRRYAVDWSRIRDMGWAPKHHLADSLPAMVAWYRENYHLFKRHLDEDDVMEFSSSPSGAVTR